MPPKKRAATTHAKEASQPGQKRARTTRSTSKPTAEAEVDIGINGDDLNDPAQGHDTAAAASSSLPEDIEGATAISNTTTKFLNFMIAKSNLPPSKSAPRIKSKTKAKPPDQQIICRRNEFPSSSPPPLDLIFTHGAASTLSAPAVVNFSHGFASMHASIFLFQGSSNLTSRARGFETVLAYEMDEKQNQSKAKPAKSSTDDASQRTIALGGRSMGARAAVIAAQQYSPTTSLLVLASYPLVAANSNMRDGILLALPPSAFVLFISGDRDNMCPLDKLNQVRDEMKASSWLVTVRQAEHGMNLRGVAAAIRPKATQDVGEECGRIAARWLDEMRKKREKDTVSRKIKKDMEVFWNDKAGVLTTKWLDSENAGTSHEASDGPIADAADNTTLQRGPDKDAKITEEDEEHSKPAEKKRKSRSRR